MFKDRYSVKTHLRQLFMQKYERYLPTAFDSSHSILEKVNKIIESHNRVIDMVNNHVEFTSDQLERAFGIIDDNLARELKKFRDELTKQTEMYEDIRDKIHSDLLPDSVRRVLEEWELDGTIEEMLSEEVLTEFRMRLEDAENRIESNELMSEISVKDFSHLVDDTAETPDWTEAFNEAIKTSNNVIVPEGEYTIDPIELTTLHNGISITGRGQATKINSKSGSGVFRLQGEIGDIKRVSQAYKRGSQEIYLDDTSGLEPGDDILLQSQKNALSFQDSGPEWLLGSGTGDNPQRVPFGEFAVVDKVYSDRIELMAKPIFPHYNSHSGDEQHPVFDFSRVRKVNFVKNVTLKDFVVDDLRTGFIMYTQYARDCVLDGVTFIDSSDISSSRGVTHITRSYGCEVRNSLYDSPRDVGLGESNNYWMQNPYKVTSSQNCGFVNCKGVNSAQMVDFSFFGEALPNVGGYIKDCTSINAQSSAFTTHGGNYLMRFTGNYSEGSGQGFSHRGRGAVISNNVLIGTSYDRQDSNLGSGINLYQGGSADNLITGNQIRNFANGVGYTDGDVGLGGRVRDLNVIISNNVFDGNRRSIYMYRYHTGNPPNHDMNVTISDNHFIMKNTHNSGSQTAININERNQGITIKGNTFKGIMGEMVGFTGDRTNNFTGVTIQPNCDKIYVFDNIFMDIDRAINHGGTTGAYTEGVYPNGVHFFQKDNHKVRVRLEDRYSAGIIDDSTVYFISQPTSGITTSGSELVYYTPSGHIWLRDKDNLRQFLLSRGLWSINWNFRVSGIRSDEIVTVQLEVNDEVVNVYQVRDDSSHTFAVQFRARNNDKVRIVTKTNSSSSASTLMSGSSGQSNFSLVKIGE